MAQMQGMPFEIPACTKALLMHTPTHAKSVSALHARNPEDAFHGHMDVGQFCTEAVWAGGRRGGAVGGQEGGRRECAGVGNVVLRGKPRMVTHP